MVVFEKDIYPAFTVGDGSKILTALKALVELASKSTGDADLVFRSMNWAWPALTSRARAGSTEGVQILEGFTTLITALIRNCSVALIPALSQCKLVLRSIVRGISSLSADVAREYIRSIEERVVVQKGVRGFFLDKAAMDQFIALCDSGEDADLLLQTEKLLEKVLKLRRFFSNEVLVEFLVKLIKARSCSAQVAKLTARILSFHDSSVLYDSVMEKLTFIKFNAGSSILRKLTLINFFIEVIGSGGNAGRRLPACLTKSELTSNILNFKKNRLVAIYTLRLCRVVLARFPQESERDKLVELNSLVPIIKQNLLSENYLLLAELLGVVSEFKRSFRGSFADCKFDWFKLLDEYPKGDTVVAETLIRFIFDLYKNAVPVTSVSANMWSKFFSVSPVCAMDCFREWIKRFGSGSEAEALFRVVEKTSSGLSVATQMVDLLVNHPDKLVSVESCSLLNGIVNRIQIEDVDVVASVTKRMASLHRKRKHIQAVVPAQTKKLKKLNSEIPQQVVDPLYDLVLSEQSTVEFAKTLNASSSGDSFSVNLIEIINSNTLYSAILSLSSSHESVRSSALQVLAVVLRALAISIEAKGVDSYRYPFREAPQVAMVLTWLRNGIDPPPEASNIPIALPLISTVFVVEAIKVIFQPKHALYPLVVKHVLARPAINPVTDIQMWSSLFFTTDAANFGLFRHWMLEIIKIGAREKISVDLMTRRGAVEAVLDAAVHLNGNTDEFAACLEIISQALKTLSDFDSNDEALKFVRRYSLCQWIGFVSTTKWIKFDT